MIKWWVRLIHILPVALIVSCIVNRRLEPGYYTGNAELQSYLAEVAKSTSQSALHSLPRQFQHLSSDENYYVYKGSNGLVSVFFPKDMTYDQYGYLYTNRKIEQADYTRGPSAS